VPLLTLSIGSNIDPEANVRLVCKVLRRKFPGLARSPVYESETVGFEGDNFLNLVVATETDETLADLSVYLKALEDDMGRDRSQPHFSCRTMDVDILTYGDLCGEFGAVKLPRDEILHNAFVLQPLADLLPDAKHPLTGQSYGELWQEFDKPEQKLWPIEFDWQDDEA